MSEHISSHSQQQGRQDHENSEEDQTHQTSEKYLKLAPEASDDGLGCATPDWQKKFSDFVGAEKAVYSEPDPNTSDDASRQNPEGDMEESPVTTDRTTAEFFIVEDIQEEVEVETDANANYQ